MDLTTPKTAPSSAHYLGGLPHITAFAWQLAKLLHDGSATALVPESSFAMELKNELCVFRPDLEILVLPSLETDLLRNRGPTTLKRQERIRFLTHLHAKKPLDARPKLFLFTIGALLQKTPAPKFWTEHLLHLKVGAECSRTDFADQLTRLGYLPSELVEKPFEYALRGSIVDVFSPLYDHPLRLELFDDEIQSIRSFQPQSQRRLDELSECYVPPAREFLFDESDEALSATRSKLRAMLDEQNYARPERDAILNRIQQRSFFPTVDYWAAELAAKIRFESPVPTKIDFHLEAHAFETRARLKAREVERDFSDGFVEGEWVPPVSVFINALEPQIARIRDLITQPQALWLESRMTSGLDYEPASREPAEIASLSGWGPGLGGGYVPDLSPFERLGEKMEFLRKEKGRKILFCASSPAQIDRANFLFTPYGVKFRQCESFDAALSEDSSYVAFVGSIEDGFEDIEKNFVLIQDEHLFGSKKKRSLNATGRSQKRQQDAAAIFTQDFSLMDLKPQDLVAHKKHGIGRYLGLKVMNFQGIPTELLEIEYRDNTKLFVPVNALNQLQKHSNAQPEATLDKLGGNTWDAKKAKVKRELQSLAGELLLLYSKREMAQGPKIAPSDAEIQRFAATFPYTETQDQMGAIVQAITDMRGPKPMDRLLCGDVGYGKTEVALRAAHAALAAGFQVVVLAPTTLLAAQHENTFRKRLGPLGFEVAGLSRFKSTKEAKEIVEKVKSGAVRCVIGTHRLLGNAISFENLGLMVIDEEQRFGVAHKEKLKKLRNNVHVLSMTATPIPRTLNMAMSGIKDLSIITTAPQDRLSVRTHVARKKAALIKEAIEQEIHRGGQVYYVHNRVQTIEREVALIRELFPQDVRIDFAHGQMDEETLEERMIEFYEGRTQVFVSTAIVESGLDVPNANTLIVDRADTFGLAQLYQLRGRVGRSTQRAYAFLLLPEQGQISKDAEERLGVLETYQELGSGFHIASHDLELRGAGDFLGRSQSGHISSIGFDAYTELLQEAIAELKGEQLEEAVDPEITLGIDTTIPDTYVPEFGLRLMFYKRLASATDEEDIRHLELELEDRFGSLPESVKNLVAIMTLRIQLRNLGIRSFNAGKNGYMVVFDAKTPVDAQTMVKAVQKYPSHFQLYPDGRLLLKRVGELQDAEKIMRGISVALAEVESWIK